MRLNVLIFLTVYELKLFLFCSSLREKCPNTEFFLVRIFPDSDEYGEIVFLRIKPGCGKIRTRKKLRISTLFAQCLFSAMKKNVSMGI